MKYVLLILKYLGLTLLGILGLLLLALILPLTARLHYEGGIFTVKVRLLFFWITVFPQKEKKQKKKRKARGKEEKPEESDPKKRSGINFQMILDLLPPAKSFLGRVLRSIRIQNVYLRLIARGKDMAETGITAGRIWAAIGGGTAMLNNVFRISYKDIVVVPDFMEQYEGNEKFDCKITVIPVIIVIAAVGFLFRFLAASVRNRENEESEATGNGDRSK